MNDSLTILEEKEKGEKVNPRYCIVRYTHDSMFFYFI